MKTELWVAIVSGIVATIGIVVKGLFQIWTQRIDAKAARAKAEAVGAHEKQKAAYALTSSLKQRIDRQRAEWSASRVYVSLLHNGSNYGIKGLHFEKLTVAFESVDHLTRTSYGIIKDYPVLQFSPLIEALHNDGKYHRSYHDEPSASESRIWMEQNQIHDEFMAPVTDERGVIVGIVGATYHGTRASWTDGDWDLLRDLAENVTNALTAVVESGGSGVINWK